MKSTFCHKMRKERRKKDALYRHLCTYLPKIIVCALLRVKMHNIGDRYWLVV